MTETVNNTAWLLSDGWWALQGYDIIAEPFIKDNSDLKIYKNYWRDTSGRYDGYIIKRKSEKTYTYVVRTIGDMQSIHEIPFAKKE